MTNGEKIKEIFPKLEWVFNAESEYYKTHIDDIHKHCFDSDWWHSEYKEPATQNDLEVDCISRKAVRKILVEAKELGSWDDSSQINRLDAIDNVDMLPSVTPQLSSGLDKNSKKLEKDLGELDCISRADAIRVASGYCHPSNVANELAKLPSVTPQEPKSEWQHDHEILKAYSDGASEVLDKIRAEIERQEKWLMVAGYNAYNVDIAFNAIKLVVDKYKSESEET